MENIGKFCDWWFLLDLHARWALLCSDDPHQYHQCERSLSLCPDMRHDECCVCCFPLNCHALHFFVHSCLLYCVLFLLVLVPPTLHLEASMKSVKSNEQVHQKYYLHSDDAVRRSIAVGCSCFDGSAWMMYPKIWWCQIPIEHNSCFGEAQAVHAMTPRHHWWSPGRPTLHPQGLRRTGEGRLRCGSSNPSLATRWAL